MEEEIKRFLKATDLKEGHPTEAERQIPPPPPEVPIPQDARVFRLPEPGLLPDKEINFLEMVEMRASVREYSDEVHLDYVISQEPEAGETIRQDERVILHVSKGYDNQPAATVAPAEPLSTEPTKADGEKEDKKKTGGTYILDGSDKRIISRSEVTGLDNNEMTLALNEIFARHGRKFNTPSIQAYFDKQSWYKGTISAADFDEDVLSAVERTNVNTILSVMEEKGYR